MARLLTAAAAACLVSLVAACGGDSDAPVSPGGGNGGPAPVGAVVVTPATASVVIGRTTQLAATAKDAAGNVLTGRAVAWSSSAPAVATVDATTGVVTGVSAGAATVTATSEGKTGTAAVTVSAAVKPVAAIAIAPTLDTLEAFSSELLAAVPRDAEGNILTGREVRWSVSNAAVAAIDPVDGMLTGVDRGTVTVTATSEGKSTTATRVVVIKYRSISAGTMHACDIASGGIAWCWGLNGNEGRIGSGQLSPTAMSAVPVKVPGNLRFAQLSTYGRHTCGITLDGKGYCWGYNGWGMLGDGSNSSQSPSPVAVAGNLTFRSITAGADHSCGVATDNRAYCWGNNDWRQLGTGTAPTSTPVLVSAALSFTKITAGQSFTCGLTTAGATYCWGANSIGQLGDGKPIAYGNVYNGAPQQVVGNQTFQSISLGNQYACAITTIGQGYCWGSNNTKFGNGNTTDSSSPVAMAGGIIFQSISTGFGHACGVTSTQAVYCWGSNSSGQLGAAVANGSTVPVRAGSLLAAEVAASGIATGSGSHTCAISTDRLTAWCWGRNDVGQLGNGGTTAGATANPTPAVVVSQKPL